jgi:hypothetical protein
MRWTANPDFWRPKTTAILLFVLLAAGFHSTVRDIVRPFWYDEIIAVIICRLPSGSAIWTALDHAVDTSPPSFYLLARAARQIIPEDHLGYRLPSTLGLLFAIAGVYLFLSRRLDSLSALAGATFLLCTPLATYYASEARPYALMIGCVTGAIVAWQRIDIARSYSWALAAALAAATSLHYYAILVWPAFVVAETSIWLFQRRLRFGPWAALFAGTLPFLFSAPLLLKLHQHLGKNYFAQPVLTKALSIYVELFNFGDYYGITFAIGIAVAFAYAHVIRRQRGAGTGMLCEPKIAGTSLPVQEHLLILMLLCLPVAGVIVAKVGQGGMTSRYVMPAIVGGALAFGYLISMTHHTARLLLLALMLLNYGFSSFREIGQMVKGRLLEERLSAAGALKDVIAKCPIPDVPVVVSSGIQYLPMAYYTPNELRGRLYAVTDPPAAVKYTGSDTVELNLLGLRPYFPLQVEDFRDFASKHREFLLVSGGAYDWWPARLSDEGNMLTLLSTNARMGVYKVTLLAR